MSHLPSSAPTPSAPYQPVGLVEKVLERIRKNNVVPRPRWEYVLKNGLFWMLWALCTIAGAAALAAGTFVFANAGWEFRQFTHSHLWTFLFDTIPVLWIAMLLLLMAAAYGNLRQTILGYRYSIPAVVGLSLLGSIVLGASLYAAGIGQRVDELLGDRPPFHRPILAHERGIWLHPSQGLLGGDVLNMADGAETMTLRTFDGAEWIVLLDEVDARGRTVLAQFPTVRVVGIPTPIRSTSTAPSTFHACFVFPWMVRGEALGGDGSYRVTRPSIHLSDGTGRAPPPFFFRISDSQALPQNCAEMQSLTRTHLHQ